MDESHLIFSVNPKLRLISIHYKYQHLLELDYYRSDLHPDMFRLVLLCALALAAHADVSHLLRSNRPFAAPSRSFAPAAPASYSPGRQVAILRQSQDVDPDGGYQFSFETENGIAAEERAQVRAAGNELEKVAQGAFHWTSPEGEQVSVSYVADGNGYQPQGSHLPVAPPIPPAIQRALDWIAAHPQPAEREPVYRRF
ncbi:hypothetical protein Zmor_013085 [Zophobas morio]|uniref:Uncharacterized protein n=1 Tax=Zophobas morio TaxID=2755281 RepID=A0AA38IF06_9CUCU|nr:hypothetical protein Zmor_013085 [Zophobas morio]